METSDEFGLVERANKVLALGQVNSGLASDRRIHHSQHTGRNLSEGHASKVRGGHVTGQIADDASSKSDDQVAALGLVIGKPGVDVLGVLQGLALLAGRDEELVGGDTLCLHRDLRSVGLEIQASV